MSTPIGVLKVAAMRIGVSHAEYQARMAAGERWCTGCKEWHDRASFNIDRSRGYGISAMCKAKERAKKLARPHYQEIPERLHARRFVRNQVRYGRRPHARTLPCTDCGEMWRPGLPSYEYDHYLGYAPEHKGDVQVVCRPCHFARGVSRGEFRWKHRPTQEVPT